MVQLDCNTPSNLTGEDQCKVESLHGVIMTENYKSEIFNKINSASITAILCFVLFSLCLRSDVFEFGFIEVLFLIGLSCLSLINGALAFVNYKLLKLDTSSK